MINDKLKAWGRRSYSEEGQFIYIDSAVGALEVKFLPQGRTVELFAGEQARVEEGFTGVEIINLHGAENPVQARCGYGSFTKRPDVAEVQVTAIKQAVEVSSIAAPVAVSSIQQPVTVGGIANPVGVSSIAAPVAVSGIQQPVTVGSITNPVTVSAIADPVTVAGITNPVTVNQPAAAGVAGQVLTIAAGSAVLAANPARRSVLVRAVGAQEVRIGAVVLSSAREIELPVKGAVTFSGTDGATVACIEILD